MIEEKGNQTPEANSSARKSGAVDSLWFFIWDFLKVLALALAIIIPVRYFLFQPFIVTGQSMQPNFHQGEYLIIDEISYRFFSPSRGDVAVIHSPVDNSEYFIKRIIGLPGETVEIKNGTVVIKNSSHPEGLTLVESYIPPEVATFGNIKVTLSKDQFYVLGDNRLASSDSRYFGPIKGGTIVGRVLIRAFPFGKFTAFQTPSYQF